MRSHRTEPWAVVALGVSLLLTGCQSLMPGGPAPGVTSRTSEKQIAKLAKNDPFPTPQQVGIRGASATDDEE